MGVSNYKPVARYNVDYINGYHPYNDTTSPTTVLNISTGSCYDSSTTFQMISTSVLTISTAIVGAGGLDTGTITASKLYYVYIIGDIYGLNPLSAMISLSSTGPTMPSGYNMYRKVDYVRINASSQFTLARWMGKGGSWRKMEYDGVIATAITAGAATTATAVSLAELVPSDLLHVIADIKVIATPSAAGRIVSVRTYGNTNSTNHQVYGQVATVVTAQNHLVPVASNSGAPSVEYLWSAGGGDAVALSVSGFEYWLV